MADERTSLPQSRAVPRRQTRISLVWVIPLVALAVGVWVGISRLRSEGPEITITFNSAEAPQPVQAPPRFGKHKTLPHGS